MPWTEFERATLSPSGVRVHVGRVRPPGKMKTTGVEVRLAASLAEDATRTALVPFVLARGTARLASARAIAGYLEDLYDAAFDPDVARYGDVQVAILRLEVADARYLRLPAGGRAATPLAEGIAFLAEVLAAPRLDATTDLFPEDVVASEKEQLGRFVRGLRDDRAEYAIEQATRAVSRGEPAERYEYGDVRELAAIGPADLTARWRTLVASRRIDLLVAGEHGLDEVLEACAAAGLDALRGAGPRLDPPATRPSARPAGTPPRVVGARAEVEQAHLCVAYRTGVPYLEDDAYAATVLFQCVLGGEARSRLYARVRESEKLAYDAATVFDRQKGVVLAHCGIDAENARRAVSMVETEVRSLAVGEVGEEELESARKACLARLADIEDEPALGIGFEYARSLAGRQDVGYEALRGRLAAVTAADVSAAARRAELDVIYLLLPR